MIVFKGLMVFLLCLILKGVQANATCSLECQNEGTCTIISPGNETCMCSPGYVGHYCQFHDPCQNDPCSNEGICTSPLASNGRPTIQCSCPIGYTGTQCEQAEPTICNLEEPCENGGLCRLKTKWEYECECTTGFTGENCTETDHCIATPCHNDAACFSNGNGFTCDCNPGYTGTHCDEDVNECAGSVPMCHNGGTCFNTYGSFECRCTREWTGPFCDYIFVPCQPSPCLNGGVCERIGTYTHVCHCHDGFEGSNCEININDCTSQQECQNGGVCMDGDNSYSCQCPAEFTGPYCTDDVDECVTMRGICQNGATCSNTIGGFECLCVNGYEVDFCETNVDDCGAGSRCLNGGTCLDFVGSFRCECPPGYTGFLCHLEDACVSNPCHPNAQCFTNPTSGDAVCNCPRGFIGSDCSQDIDECTYSDESPCKLGGTCVNTEGSFHCICPPGITGARCEQNIDECESRPCVNAGTCLNLSGGFQCVCLAGFTGIYCESDVDECDSDPCQNNGICVDKENHYECECLEGFTGRNCEDNINECLSTPCQNGARCEDGYNEYICQCTSGYTGVNCETDIDDCRDNPCRNGICHDGLNSFTCECNEGFEGRLCMSEIDECASNPCQNNGECRDFIGSYACICQPGTTGYTGVNCETDIDDCRDNPCRNGICHDGLNSFTCECNEGFEGRLCMSEIDECASNPCQNNGECRDFIGSYACICQPGTTGDHCEIDIYECASNPCQNHATCHNIINGYYCECIAGYKGNLCEQDINECLSHPCANGGTCYNEVNGFTCHCPHGFYDALCLSDINECESNPCINGGTCVDGVNDYSCECPSGYGGSTCHQDIDECVSNPCQHGGQCTSGLDFFSCICPEGYSGEQCEDNVMCASSPCANSGTCIGGVTAFECLCIPPYTGETCEELMTPCDFHNCQNGATCMPSPSYNSYYCRCVQGLTGQFCEDDIDECQFYPCHNGATCNNTYGTYNCLCPEGYSGRDCINNVNDCASDPCKNGGTCIDKLADYTCACMQGFDGKNCETDINECASYPCQYGATCHDYVASFTCLCSHGFSGVYCQANDNDCTDSSCLNGGTCEDGINTYSCSCAPGYTGPNCQHIINECEANPCQNGANCVDHNGFYRCECALGYQGSTCGELIDWCSNANNPCRNNGVCTQQGPQYTCNCRPGWQGLLCDVRQVSCELAAQEKAVRSDQLCLHGGTCIGNATSHMCQCSPGYSGSYCETRIDECTSWPCRNGGTCVDAINSYNCNCRLGFEGANCDIDVNECESSPCVNGGMCHDLVGTYQCSCPRGTEGQNCHINLNDCFSGACFHGGTCNDLVGTFECDCPGGFSGQRCEGDVNECLTNECNEEGTQDCIQATNNYECVCKLGYYGPLCDQEMHLCEPNPCQNEGQCSVTRDGFQCKCPPDFQGTLCNIQIGPCYSSPCINSGTCTESKEDESGYHCICPEGTLGRDCEHDVDECRSSPCQNGGQCINEIGHFMCDCPQLFNGVRCDIFDSEFEGGIGRLPVFTTIIPEPPRTNQPTTVVMRDRCPLSCADKKGNGIFNEDCNTQVCDFDGKDCSLGVSPWSNCTVTAVNCFEFFQDGVCHEVCNNPNCLFDGYDCEKGVDTCNEIYDSYCETNYANGACDYVCDVPECGHDGLDCDTREPDLAKGTLIVVVRTPPDIMRQENVSKAFLRDMGALLHTVLVFAKDRNGENRIEPWIPEEDTQGGNFIRMKRSAFFGTDGNHQMLVNRVRRQLVVTVIEWSKIFLLIDNRGCHSNEASCFHSTEDAVSFFGALAQTGNLPDNLNVHSVEGQAPPATPASTLYVIVPIGIIISMCVVSFGVIRNKRCRSNATWFPENHLLKDYSKDMMPPPLKRHRPVGREDTLSGTDSNENDVMEATQLDDFNAFRVDQFSSHSDQPPYTTDLGTWSPRSRMPPSQALMPPQGELPGGCIADRGQDGMTPLMCAVISGANMSDSESEDSFSVIDEMIVRTDVNHQNHRTGETALHLAARYNNPVAAKKLLEAGAQPNAEDGTGRTPLHTAVAADAIEVFRILIMNRSTKRDAKAARGATPMIMAARMTVDDMIPELVEANANVNETDQDGKTALHWAAEVNNTEAAAFLLTHRANKDAQDMKDETPLFLAAKEGHFETVKLLLDHYANREISDHLDLSPRDAAMEARYQDIVNLLDKYKMATSPGALSPNGPITSPVDMHNGDMHMVNDYMSHHSKPGAKTNGLIDGHGRDMMKGHKSPARRLSGNEARSMQKYATHNTQIPNPHNPSMMTTSITEKFPTPPSQDSQRGIPSADNLKVPNLEHFLTPSPESPGQWSSSSLQSADWSGSEGISSPPQLACTQSPGGKSMVDAWDNYQINNGHISHHNQLCLDSNATKEATHINSVHESVANGAEIVADTRAPSACQVQDQSGQNSRHENYKSVMQPSTLQSSVPCVHQTATNAHSLATAVVTTIPLKQSARQRYATTDTKTVKSYDPSVTEMCKIRTSPSLLSQHSQASMPHTSPALYHKHEVPYLEPSLTLSSESSDQWSPMSMNPQIIMPPHDEVWLRVSPSRRSPNGDYDYNISEQSMSQSHQRQEMSDVRHDDLPILTVTEDDFLPTGSTPTNPLCNNSELNSGSLGSTSFTTPVLPTTSTNKSAVVEPKRDLKQILTDERVGQVGLSIKHYWREFAAKLGYDSRRCDAFTRENDLKSWYPARRMLIHWRDNMHTGDARSAVAKLSKTFLALGLKPHVQPRSIWFLFGLEPPVEESTV